MIRGISFDKQLFKSNDFALMTKRFFGNSDGIVEGCEVSSNAGNVLIEPGYFVASGYYTNLSSQEVIPVTTGKLVYEIDLSKTNTESSFLQGSFKVITIAPIQEDLFNGGTLYQYPIADVVVTGGIITELVDLTSNIMEDLLSKLNAVPTFYSGTSAPTNSEGNNGDVYYQYEL